MSRTKQQSDAEQIARVNSGPAPDEEVIPQQNIGGTAAASASVAGAANYQRGETSKLDTLDEQFLAGLRTAIAKYKIDLDLSEFTVRSLKEFVFYPGGGYVNWTMVFQHQMSGRVLRSDALVASRGDFAVIINELKSIT